MGEGRSPRLGALQEYAAGLVFATTPAAEVALLLGDWLGERYAKSRSTGDTYASCMRVYVSWCAREGVDPVLVSRREASRLVRFLDEEPSAATGRPRSAAAVNTVLSAGASWLDYAVEAQLRPEGPNPFKLVGRPVVARRPASVQLRRDHVNRLVLAAREDHVLGGALGKLIVATLALVGIRPSDLCRLDLPDARDDDAGGYELVVTAKRGKVYSRWVPPMVAADVYAYLSRSRIEPEQGDPLLVHPRLYRRVNRDDVLALVKRCAKRAELPFAPVLTARDFRRYFITATRGVADLEDRQRAAGHSSARTTELYDGTVWSRERDPAIKLASLHEDYPAEDLVRPLAHAMPEGPRLSGKFVCDCAPQWGKARVWLGPVGVDEFARIEVVDQHDPGALAALENPVCPVCHAIYLGPYRVRSVPGDLDGELLRLAREELAEHERYPEGMRRRRERGERGGI